MDKFGWKSQRDRQPIKNSLSRCDGIQRDSCCFPGSTGYPFQQLVQFRHQAHYPQSRYRTVRRFPDNKRNILSYRRQGRVSPSQNDRRRTGMKRNRPVRLQRESLFRQADAETFRGRQASAETLKVKANEFAYRIPKHYDENSKIMVLFGGRNWTADKTLKTYEFDALADKHKLFLLSP